MNVLPSSATLPSAAPSATSCTNATAVPSPPGQADFTAALHHGAWSALPQFDVIEASGDDAASFLHGQFTNDVQHLDGTRAHLAGYCSPQGRLLASFLAWRTGHAIRLLLSEDLRDSVQKRLAMFVLRAKVMFARANDTNGVNDRLMAVGFIGDVREALARITGALPDDERAKRQPDERMNGSGGYDGYDGYAQIDTPSGTLLRLPDAAGRARYLLVGPKAALEAQFAVFSEAMTKVSPAVWDWFAIRAGEPRIVQATTAQFVPQSVNFDTLGGVNFHKGCYPGQEVVARTQYRGTIKRRMALAHVATAPAVAQAGVELFHAADPAQPCGMIVNAAIAPDGGVDLLAELKRDITETGSVHIGAPDGPALHMLALPYGVADEK